MKAYLIDPKAETITEVTYDGDYKTIYPLIDAETFDVVRLNDEGDGIYVDDEGLLHEPRYFFSVGAGPKIAGKGLVLGSDDEGESTAPKISLDTLKGMVTFSQHKLLGFESFEGEIQHPTFGKTWVVGRKPVLGPPDPDEKDTN